LILPIIIVAPGLAQLSPGPLSRGHAALEGLKNCNECHELGNREIGERCIACHQEIAAQRSGGKGLHRDAAHALCADCHTEHQGTDYDLVHWRGGRDKFDHRETAWELTGGHAKLDCRKCHNAKLVSDPAALRARGKDPDRTFLGLPTECLACHGDHHRGQLQTAGAVRACTACHDTARWKPVTSFDHQKTVFPLTGRHLKVDCAKCHPALPADANDRGLAPTPKFTPVAHAACSDCHKDPHVGQLGPDCTKCHATEGWKRISGAGFDHTKTRFPLVGRHGGVACADCHGQGRQKPAFAACKDCHRDAHNAAGLKRPDLLTCETCHTVEGYAPARYGLEKHAKSAYPLRGAHQAVPCLLCHKPLPEAAGRQGPYARAVDLKPAAARCVDCHRDPHEGQVDRFAADPAAGACVVCHNETTWRRVAFDHNRSEFKLEGRHAKVACTACHKAVVAKAEKKKKTLLFKVEARHCGACHLDVHKGQFADRPVQGTQIPDCARCHVATDWLAEKFDHEKDSRFPLRGGHEKVACAKCHLPIAADNPRLLHYKPLPSECKACHINEPAVRKGQS
jgi:hypothetical protein